MNQTGELDRETIRQALRNEEFVAFLEKLSGNGLSQLDTAVEEYGREVRKAVNHELIESYQPPTDPRYKAIGYLALLYESENGFKVDEELTRMSADSADVAGAIDD